MKPYFVTLLHTEGAGNRVWRLLEHSWYKYDYPCPVALVWVDKDDKAWPIPADFLTDLYSGIRPLWWHTPPSTGQGDRPAALHDFLVRWRKVLGLSLMDCHRHFRDAMRAVKICKARVWSRYLTVVAFNWTCAGEGYGRHADERYNETFETVQDRVDKLYNYFNKSTMNRKGILYVLGFIALLVTPTLVDAMPDSSTCVHRMTVRAILELLILSAAFGMAAYITALVACIFGAIDTIVSKKKRPDHRPSEPPPGLGKNQLFIGVIRRERKNNE